MKIKKTLKWALMSLSGVISLISFSFTTIACKPTHSSETDIDKCNYIVKAQTYTSISNISETNFYIGPGIKGYVSGKWLINNFTEDFKVSITGNEFFVGANIYIPKSIDVNGTIYTVTSFTGGGDLQAKVVLPDSVIDLGRGAFENCRMTSIIFASNIKQISQDAFWGCSALTDFNFKNVVSIGNNAFKGCSGLTSLIIPNSVNYIGNGAFQDCSGLQYLNLSNVGSIGDSAFQGCVVLTSLAIPKSITFIGNSTFADCNGLQSLNLSNYTGSIGNGAFADCNGLQSLNLSSCTGSIGNESFLGCSALTSLVIPDSIVSIGNAAFQSCSGLQSLDLSRYTGSIGERSFFNCSRLTDINKIILPQTGQYSNFYVYNTPSFKAIYKNKKIIGSLAFGALNQQAFTNMGFTDAIDGSAFSNCDGLISFNLPNSVILVDSNAFYLCLSLTIEMNVAKGSRTFSDYSYDVNWNPQSTTGAIYIAKYSAGCYKFTDGRYIWRPDPYTPKYEWVSN